MIKEDVKIIGKSSLIDYIFFKFVPIIVIK